MELLRTSDEIRVKISNLEKLKEALSILSEDKAQKESAYEKTLAITIASLINGTEYELEGRSIKQPPNAMLDKLARGICWKEKFEMDVSEGKYKNCLKIIDLTQAQLNGFQSINRHLSES